MAFTILILTLCNTRIQSGKLGQGISGLLFFNEPIVADPAIFRRIVVAGQAVRSTTIARFSKMVGLISGQVAVMSYLVLLKLTRILLARLRLHICDW